MSGLDLKGLGLEIGASFNPITDDAGLNVRYLDRASREDLVKIYEPMGVDVSQIRHVDYVWSGGSYLDLVGDTRFDYIVASHVIEHMPCLVTFLNQCADILTPTGVLSLIVPDKRFCFDYFRPPAGLARVLDTYVQGATIPTPGALAEAVINASAINGSIMWGETSETPKLLHTPEDARRMFEVSRSNIYHDIHAWTFTPNSLRLLVSDLRGLSFCKLKEKGFSPSRGGEFFLQLAVEGAGEQPGRQELAEAAVADLAAVAVAEQAGAWTGGSSEAKRRWWRTS